MLWYNQPLMPTSDGGAGNTGGVVNEGDGFRISLGGQSFDYTAKDGDTLNDVATGLKRVIDAGGIDGRHSATGAYPRRVTTPVECATTTAPSTALAPSAMTSVWV